MTLLVFYGLLYAREKSFSVSLFVSLPFCQQSAPAGDANETGDEEGMISMWTGIKSLVSSRTPERSQSPFAMGHAV